MHISQMMKILNGQRAEQYQNLYSEFSMIWSGSSIQFYVVSLLGNTIQVDWGEDGIQPTIISTSGGRQIISMNYDSSLTRLITLKGSGVYTLKQLIVNDTYDFRQLVFPDYQSYSLANLQVIDFRNCRYYSGIQQPVDWRVVPKLKKIIYDDCYESLSSTQLEDKDNRPISLQYLSLNDTNHISDIYLSDFQSLKSVSLVGVGNSVSNLSGEMNLSGCPNLISAYVRDCRYVSGFYFNDCPSLKGINFNGTSNAGLYSGLVLDISNDTSLTGLYLASFGNNYNYYPQYNIKLIKKNNSSYTREYLSEVYFNDGIWPDYQTTPNLKNLQWNNIYNCSGEFNISNFTNLTDVTLNQCYDRYKTGMPGITDIICNNNRALSAFEMYYCHGVENISFQNCSKLYRLYANGGTWNSNTGQPSGQISNAIIKNNPVLNQLNLSYNTLKYNLELEQCYNIHNLELNYTQLQTLELSDITNLYRIYCQADTRFDSPLKQIKISNCYRTNSYTSYYFYRLNTLKSIVLDGYTNFDYLQFYENPSLQKISVLNGTDDGWSYPYYMIQNNPSLNYLDFSNNKFSKSFMHNIIDAIINYAQLEGGTVIFSGNQYGYKPDSTYIDNLQSSKGWTVITD